MTTPLRDPGSNSKFLRRNAKRDLALIACLNFAEKVGTEGQVEARYQLETAACELGIAERECAAPTIRKR